MNEFLTSLGAVVIGRNEGERLQTCLLSVVKQLTHVVYVDSGSTDESVSIAHELKVTVVVLDTNSPFTAGRGRNVGFTRLIELAPSIQYVQFIDGDCELLDEWLEGGQEFFRSHHEYAVVCGRLRELNPQASIYNRLCDIEWNAPVGDVDACGGIFMIRKQAFADVGGMNSTIAAGEEPEMCLRLQRQGWRIARIEKEMAFHDAKMNRFGQWWQRTVRSGFGYAQGYSLHGRKDKRYCLHDCLRIWFWALMIPVTVLLLSFFGDVSFALLLFLYPVQLMRIIIRINRTIGNWQQSFLYAIFNLIGKFPQLIGQIIFVLKTNRSA